MMDLYDVTIIGAGPAGLYSTFYAGARNLKVKCIEAAPMLGGRLTLYPHYTIHDVGGQLPISCRQFLANLIEQAQTFSPTICLQERVVAIKEQSDYLYIETTKGLHYTKTVVLATGIGYFEPKKLTTFPLSPQLEPYFMHTIDDVELLTNRHIIVYGNANITAEWAIQIEPYAKQVTVMTDEPRWQIDAVYLQQLKEKNIEAYCDVQYRDCEMIDGQMHCYFNESETAVDRIIIQPGFEKRLFTNTLQWPFIHATGAVEGDVTGTTDHPRIFAAGDCLQYDGKLNFITGAFHDAMNTINHVSQFLGAQLIPLVSTHNRTFQKK